MSPEFLSQLSDRELFPKNEQEALSHNQILTGGGEVVLMPLNPGPLGDYVTFRCLKDCRSLSRRQC